MLDIALFTKIQFFEKKVVFKILGTNKKILHKTLFFYFSFSIINLKFSENLTKSKSVYELTVDPFHRHGLFHRHNFTLFLNLSLHLSPP